MSDLWLGILFIPAVMVGVALPLGVVIGLALHWAFQGDAMRRPMEEALGLHALGPHVLAAAVAEVVELPAQREAAPAIQLAV